MFIWADGTVTGSVRWTELEDIVSRRDHESVTEAGWARLDALLAERAGAGTSQDEAAEPNEDIYEAETVVSLRELLKSRDLPTTGNKAELVERLHADDAAVDDEESDEDETSDDGEVE